MKRLKVVAWLLGIIMLTGGCLAAWLFLPWPAPPVETRITTDYDLRRYSNSMPPDSGVTDIMIVGTTHLVKSDSYATRNLNQVAESLANYKPDMVAVEYLPPDYPDGTGRDYRPKFNLSSISGMEAMDQASARQLIKQAHKSDSVPSCQLTKAYLRIRDLMNALYHWPPDSCQALNQHTQLANWAEKMRGHEAARFGFHAAKQAGLKGVVSFDYQGSDAKWFINSRVQQAIQEKNIVDLAALWPITPSIGTIPRAFESHTRPHRDNIIDYLNYYNSPEHIGLQYWVYEESLRGIRHDNIGPRQTENYWRRNEKMFDNIRKAVKEQNAERIMVIVGGGHKYFLDELATSAGYRWVDPRNYLPSANSNNS